MVGVDVSGETLTLLPERAAYWARARTLFVADIHLGKAATLQASGIPIPGGNLIADLERLSRLLSATGARALTILGDFLHAAKGRDAATLDAFGMWRAAHPELAITLVRGNHDRSAGDPPADWNIQTLNPPVERAPFILSHEPFDPVSGYALAGHQHPAALLTGAGRQSLRLPCFWFGERCGVLPAFGGFTGTALIQPRPGDRVFVITEKAVVHV